MTKKCGARLCIPNLTQHFFVILPSSVFQPFYCVSSLLEDSGRQSDENMSLKIGNAQSRETFFRHSAVLWRKLHIITLSGNRGAFLQAKMD